MSRKEIKLLFHKHSRVFFKYGIRKLAIFGSYVRGEDNKKSDIDILVEFKQPTFKNYIYLARELEKIFKRKVDLLTFSSLDRYLKPYILKEAEYIERA